MLRIKKCQWINRPEKLRILSSGSLSFRSSGEHHLVWTSDEDDDIVFSAETQVRCGAALIFSPGNGLRLSLLESTAELELDFLSLSTKSCWQTEGKKEIRIVRKQSTVSFFLDQSCVYSITLPSIEASYSLSFWTNGQGDAVFHFS